MSILAVYQQRNGAFIQMIDKQHYHLAIALAGAMMGASAIGMRRFSRLQVKGWFYNQIQFAKLLAYPIDYNFMPGGKDIQIN
jgi:hypothetical protein